MKHLIEYQLINKHYGTQVATRSQVPLINHINEGLVVLDAISATDSAKRAYCLHPLLQGDADLHANREIVTCCCDSYVIMLAMEYRSVANEYLSGKINTGHTIRLSPLSEVNDMLIADKVQNRKDFITYHKGSHPRSNELDQYFSEWLHALDISEDTYQLLCNRINLTKSQ